MCVACLDIVPAHRTAANGFSSAVSSAEFATNLKLPRKAPNLGPIKKIKVDDGIIYLKDATGTTLVELDVELTVD